MSLRWKDARRLVLLAIVMNPTFALGQGQSGPVTPTPFDRPSFCRTPGLEIPDDDDDGVEDSLVIPNEIPIADLDVLVRIAHPFIGDLVVILTHVDSGTSATLIDRPLFPKDLFGCVGPDIDTLLDDEAEMAAEETCEPSGAPVLRGRLRPNDPLSRFDSESLAGTWTLNVSDRSLTDVGTLDAWCLVYGSGLPDTPTPTSTITPTFTSTPTRTRTITPTQPTFTRTPTGTITPTFATFTATATPTITPTRPTPTTTQTPTSTPTQPTSTATRTGTVTPTGPTPTSTRTPTITPTRPSPTQTVPGNGTPTNTPTPPPGSTSTPTSTPTTSLPPTFCIGDCNLDEEVTVDELVIALEVTLSRLGLGACLALDGDRNGVVTVNEPVAAVAHAIRGCE